MDITELPFNQLIGLELSPPDSDFLITLPPGIQYTNHLGTVHAGALFAVAEAASGVYLLRELGSLDKDVVPVVRRVDVKFRRPARGRVNARAIVAAEEVERWSEELDNRGRVLADVAIEVVDQEGVVVVTALVEWFIALAEK
jgi:acyl-coenzyme A thioesterase PaaI-like protein